MPITDEQVEQALEELKVRRELTMYRLQVSAYEKFLKTTDNEEMAERLSKTLVEAFYHGYLSALEDLRKD